MNILALITYSGTFVFALTGALKAKRHQMDIFGAAVLAFVTAYGGGTIRDILIGASPVNWINDYLALSLVIAAVFITIFLNYKITQVNRSIFITDAVGLGLFTIAGLEKSLEYGVNSTYAVIMGVISATFGGLLADILSNTVPDLLKKGELYATASLIGGVVYILLLKWGIAHDSALLVCVLLVVAIRIVSKIKRLMLPQV